MKGSTCARPLTACSYQAHADDPQAATSVLLVTRNYMNSDELSANVKRAHLGLQMMYIPTAFELPLRDLVKGNADIYTFARNGEYNLSPTTDDQPFFYQLNWGLPDCLPIVV